MYTQSLEVTASSLHGVSSVLGYMSAGGQSPGSTAKTLLLDVNKAAWCCVVFYSEWGPDASALLYRIFSDEFYICLRCPWKRQRRLSSIWPQTSTSRFLSHPEPQPTEQPSSLTAFARSVPSARHCPFSSVGISRAVRAQPEQPILRQSFTYPRLLCPGKDRSVSSLCSKTLCLHI